MFRLLIVLVLSASSVAFAQEPPRPQRGPVASQVDKWPSLPPGAGLLVQPLVSSPEASMSLLAIAPKSAATHDRAISGQFVVYVLEGTVAVNVAKEKPLGAGDVALFTADGTNRLSNTGKKTAQLLVVELPGAMPLDFERAEAGDTAEAASPPTIVRASAAKKLPIAEGRGSARMLLEGDAAYPAYVGVLRAEAGLAVPLHQHGAELELLFVLQGEGDLTLLGQTGRVTAGSAILIPKGEPHAFVHRGKKPFEAVQIYTPPGPEQRFKPQK